jgi:extracellular matrix regulatory protein B
LFLHIGNNYLLKKSEVIGLFNVDALNEDNKGRKFLNEIKQSGRAVDISDGKWCSIVLTEDAVYVSRISTTTLLARSKEDINELLTSSRRPGSAAAADGIDDDA